ncbi:hypothetical protein BGZ61DRAFT_447299 [Ilyonectria robusta]|uniref:uncharacterized protein n=1 Tax=Ilyonectria robusta TaxID=1079257 RepID=UPI001E8CF790|nr:uncharacterized protein BGZ61DRAFT_447299 [Ilyonectria robusta]KAH8721620.1 hypothetical protein BGZ61DRAFT_447299 [Ilyonectria robusta]
MHALPILSLTILAGALLNPFQFPTLPISTMTDRKKIIYTFDGIEEWQKLNHTVTVIVKEDTGSESWISDRALPPTSHPPPLTLGGIQKLQDLDGVIVKEVVEDK